MLLDRDMPGMRPEPQDMRVRPAPRCYARVRSQAIQRPHEDSNAIVIALSIISCVAGFLLVSGGWSL
jgi:hypothetical protein